jgi:phage-related protein
MPRPYSDILHDGIHELRISLSGDHYRFLYFFCYEKYIVIFQVLVKHTDRVPEKIISSMIEYKKQLLLRTTEKELDKNYRNNTSPLSFHSVSDKSYSDKS